MLKCNNKLKTMLIFMQNWEFEVYERYADAFNEDCRRMLEELLCRPDIEVTVSTAGHGFVEAVKFYFPKLLLEPFYHWRQYFDYIPVKPHTFMNNL